jgi:hypothetical protein
MEIKNNLILFIVVLMSFTLTLSPVFAIMNAPSSPSINEVTIDGKWTNAEEWTDATEYSVKTSSASGNFLGYILIKDDGEFLYVMIDYIADKTIEDNDEGRVRFDINNDKTDNLLQDDYIFTMTWKTKNATMNMLQGDGEDWISVQKIPSGIEAATTNDRENNPYSDYPHIIYEFIIPREFFGEKSEVGFSVIALDWSRMRAQIHEDDGLNVIRPRTLIFPEYSSNRKSSTWSNLTFATIFEKPTPTPTPKPSPTPSPTPKPTQTPTPKPIPGPTPPFATGILLIDRIPGGILGLVGFISLISIIIVAVIIFVMRKK